MVDNQDTPSVEEFFAIDATPKTSPFAGPRCVIPDVHGDLGAITRSVNAGLSFLAGEQPEIIFLGDVIDRGPHALPVLKYISKLQNDGYTVSTLIGNHESMFIQCLFDLNTVNVLNWFRNGGVATLRSLSLLTNVTLSESDWNRIETAFLTNDMRMAADAMRESDYLIREMFLQLKNHKFILDFLNSLQLCIQRERDLYVHAGFLPGFVLSYTADNTWSEQLNDQFKLALNDFMHPLQTSVAELSFEEFLTVSSFRGGESVAGPLWADINDFSALTTFEIRLLVSLLKKTGCQRMVVGHCVFDSPKLVNLSDKKDWPVSMLFLDCGISMSYPGTLDAQCLAVNASGNSFVLDHSGNFVKT